MQELMEKIKTEARGGWPGEEGERRATTLENFLTEMLADYSVALGLGPSEILAAMEARRTYSAVNYYQTANYPPLENVRIFNDMAELRAAIPSRQFRCPMCGAISTDPYECDSGAEMSPGKRCDWKTYGLFRTCGKGFRFTIREGFLEKPFVDEIFMPIEMEQAAAAAGSENR